MEVLKGFTFSNILLGELRGLEEQRVVELDHLSDLIFVFVERA